ncbi:hypothetical protein ACFPAF_01145 [Hymenobacter endophyticus]|uniref:Uncharacterized protein n=1 Tax=Hymenobacter endophyticus TaxID=3076335 RepID=A0ABU3TCC4_9BACT|nr:hypothetical protein [Hymenobacter endophyticus]MDU0368984.1 hypothetical protein [Hymenobacter endophyticus]
MDDWMAGLIGGLAGGAVVLLLRLLPASNNRDGSYRRHLTNEEKAQLRAGQIVTKTHRASSDIWGKHHYEGPLRVEQLPDSKLRFTPFGTWQQTKADGRISSTWEYTGIGQETITRAYHPNGAPDVVIYWVPAVLQGDSVREERVVYFKLDNPQDTAFVQHDYYKNNRSLKKSFWSYDARGKQPVPAGWKFIR